MFFEDGHLSWDKSLDQVAKDLGQIIYQEDKDDTPSSDFLTYLTQNLSSTAFHPSWQMVVLVSAYF